jgi:hypothetical protein
MAGTDFSSMHDQVNAIDTINARLEQVQGILAMLQAGSDNENLKSALWGAGELLEQAQGAAGKLRQ